MVANAVCEDSDPNQRLTEKCSGVPLRLMIVSLMVAGRRNQTDKTWLIGLLKPENPEQSGFSVGMIYFAIIMHMRTIERDIVAALIFSRDGKLLLGKMDPATSVYPGCWVIPGGGVESGESKTAALRREILEETGIDITSYRAILVDDTAKGESEKNLKDNGERVRVKMNFFDFRVDIHDKSAQELGNDPTDELLQLAWVDLRDVANYRLSQPTLNLLNKLRLI